MKNGQFPAIIQLSSLNGQNGFKIDGEVIGAGTGWYVSAAGDINDDGSPDLMISAFNYANETGRTYVIFGGSNVGHSGLLPLSSLNGANGFKVEGETVGDFSGGALSAVGDFNGDGKSDVLISAPYHGNYAGRSYVIFGGPTVGSSGLLPLSSLNGLNGFKLDGESAWDLSGFSLSAGDINTDGHMDILIGARGYAGSAGCSYVVFGGPSVGSGGLLPLSSLNGTNGFKLTGEAANDLSGSVSVAEDINGDQYADVLIGAYGHANNTGRSYVVFGGSGIGSSGLLMLSSLNGVTGFKIDGEMMGDISGSSVSSGGDINGDGYADILIGAQGHANNTGRSYILFGGPNVGRSGLLSLASLNGLNGFKLDGATATDRSGNVVKIIGDINGDGLADVLIATPYPAATGRSYVVFGGAYIGGSRLCPYELKWCEWFSTGWRSYR